MLKFELPNIIPSPGNPFTPVFTTDTRSAVETGIDLPIAHQSRQSEAPPEPVDQPAPLATTMAQLLEALQGADCLFQQALGLARQTRSRETELLQRAEDAERESRHQEREASEWKDRYQALDAKIPWWVRKLFRAS